MNAHVQLAELRRTADELDTLLGGDDERLFHDMLLGETDIDRMVLRIHEQIARDEEMLVGIGERQAAIADRKGRIVARRDGAKRFIGTILRTAHLAKLELPEVTYSVRDGKPSLKVVDPEAVPVEYQRVKAEPDKPKINAAFADADTLPNWLVREPARDVVTGRVR